MESRAKLLGHAIHPILIVFPLGLLTTSVIFDVVYLITSNRMFGTVSFWMLVAGVIGGLIASLPGWIDWFAIPSGTRAKSVGLLHGIGNVILTLLFIVAWYLRQDNPDYAPETLSYIFSFAAAALSAVTGWLGGELVERLGVGVDEGVHLDAPNSLSGKPAASSK